MTLIDKLRFHSILTRAGWPEAPSIEFADALQDTFDAHTSQAASKDDLERLWDRVDKAILAAENRLTRLIVNVALGTIAVAVAIAATGVGIILGFG